MSKALRIRNHLRNLDRGVDKTKLPLPRVTSYLNPDRPTTGRFVVLVGKGLDI
ncbi:hypothetical protein NFO65_18575 [Neorhizobium galegae]|uniref:hypothetical protein n=1 Tax=Neorhizobium galegae TaxID=399 RepID=UPI002101678F|nr:hypothetical protein [Neorhizobium galegae]MCQ1572737.1 hypothetical protein [Neorhizobium galegae]